MKIYILYFISFLIFISIFSSCMTTKTSVGEYKQQDGDVYTYAKAKQIWLFWGIVPIGRTDVATPTDGNCEIVTRKNVADVIITGETLPKVVPANSDIEITLTFDQNGAKPVCSVFFPVIDHTEEVDVEISLQPKVESDWLIKEIQTDIKRANRLSDEKHNDELLRCCSDLEQLNVDLTNEGGSEDDKMRILNSLRKIRTILDDYETDLEWPKAETDLKNTYYKAEELIEKIDEAGLWGDINETKVRQQMVEFKSHIESVIKEKDIKLAIEITENIMGLMRALVETFRDEGEREKDYINYIDENFSRLPWKDANRARQLVNQAIININNNGNQSQLEQLCFQIDNLRDRSNPNQPDDIPTF